VTKLAEGACVKPLNVSEKGQIVVDSARIRANWLTMTQPSDHDVQAMVPRPETPGNRTGPETLFEDLLDHLVRSSTLGRREAEQIVGEVMAYFNETVEAFVKRRHGELQKRGLANPEIFTEISGELRWWRVAAPMLSQRQIRRIIYG
jgi:hypothetical protein